MTLIMITIKPIIILIIVILTIIHITYINVTILITILFPTKNRITSGSCNLDSEGLRGKTYIMHVC